MSSTYTYCLAGQLARGVLEGALNAKDLLRRYHIKPVTSLGWMLRNWRRAEGFAFDYSPDPRGINDGTLLMSVRGDVPRSTLFASLSVCWNFLDRPIFRGLPFQLYRPNGTRAGFTIGDGQWRVINKLPYPDFLRVLGLRNADGTVVQESDVKRLLQRFNGEMSTRTVQVDGTVVWLDSNGKLHRLTGPAVESNQGRQWWLHGQLHREGGPAVEWNTGDSEWWLHGKRHRLGGPAMEWADGTRQWWEHGVRIR